MIKIPPHPRSEDAETRIYGFEVRLSQSKGGVHVTFANYPDDIPREPFSIILSPPAAHQLGKALRRTVKGYLHQQREAAEN